MRTSQAIAFIGLVGMAMMSRTTFAGDDVYVNGYFRSDGTYIDSHYRSAPDGDLYNNFGSLGNTNPYTGSVGTRTPSFDTYSTNRADIYGGYNSRPTESGFSRSATPTWQNDDWTTDYNGNPAPTFHNDNWRSGY